VTEAEIIAFVATLGGVSVQTASEGDGSPESAWGDSFFTIPGQQMPFATLVASNYPGFDDVSDLDRDGVFRLNVSVGRERFTELVGHAPSTPADEHVDYAAPDTLLPHPQYAKQAWVSIVNPGPSTDELAKELIEHAHRRATGMGS
jgi:hypothetical protein